MCKRTPVVVFYHGSCIDGACAAWALNEAYKNNPAMNISFVPMTHSTPDAQRGFVLNHVKKNADVYFLDISPKAPTLNALINEDGNLPTIGRLTVIDHHSSEIQPLLSFVEEHPHIKGNKGVRFILDGTSPAAALMSWNTFHPNKPAPELFRRVGMMEDSSKMIENSDLSIASYIDSFSLSSTEDAFDTINELVSTDLQTMILQGNAILTEQLNNVSKSRTESLMYTRLEIAPKTMLWMPIINLNVKNFGRLVDRFLIGAKRDLMEAMKLNPDHGVAAAWFVDGNNIVQMSLRTEKSMNAGNIAAYWRDRKVWAAGSNFVMGGGGKQNAACVQFAGLKDFVNKVDLYTKEQLSDILKQEARQNHKPSRHIPLCLSTTRSDKFLAG